MKNKAEANELFGDGNYKHACARYAKALSHCNKLYDLSPDDEVEVSSVFVCLFCFQFSPRLQKMFISCR